MVPLIILPSHSESQLLLQGAGVGGPFLGQSEGLRAPFFGDGPPTSTSFLEGSSTERARRSALRVGLRVEDSHQPQRSDASILPQRLSLQQPFSGNDTFAHAELRLSSGKRRREVVFSAPVTLGDRSVYAPSVAVGLCGVCASDCATGSNCRDAAERWPAARLRPRIRRRLWEIACIEQRM
jgi:hypothetical protein